jgi:hypothetical protein
MSGGTDDKKNRFKVIAGGKSEPSKPIRSGRKPITNSTKSRTCYPRVGHSAKDIQMLEDATKLIKDLEKELGLNHSKLPKDK